MYAEGDRVEWAWGNGTATGTIDKVFIQDKTLTIKGTEVTRKASKDEPAYLIRTEDSEALKSHSEVRRA